MNARSLVVVFAVVAFDVVACNDTQTNTLLPSAPTTPTQTFSPAPTPGPGPGPDSATPIQSGQLVAGVLHGSDPPCVGFSDPQDTSGGTLPCQAYRISAPQNGVLTIRIAWDNPTDVLCAVDAFPGDRYGQMCRATSPITLVWQVVAQQAYGFGVEFAGTGTNQTLLPDASQSYTVTSLLTTSIQGQTSR